MKCDRKRTKHGAREYFSGDSLRGRNLTEAVVSGQPFALTDKLDRRTSAYRSFMTLQDAIAADLGGIGHLSVIQMRLLQHTAALSLYLEREELRLLNGEDLEYRDLYLTGLNTFRRLGQTLGLRRVPKQAQTLEEYLACKRSDDG